VSAQAAATRGPRAAAAHREERAQARARPTTRSARICANADRDRSDLLDERTTGAPSYVPLTATDLENWVTGRAQLCRLRRLRRPAHRLQYTRAVRGRRRACRFEASASVTFGRIAKPRV